MPVTVPVQQNSAYPQQQTQQNSNVGQTLMPPQTHQPGNLSPVRPSSTGMNIIYFELDQEIRIKRNKKIFWNIDLVNRAIVCRRNDGPLDLG